MKMYEKQAQGEDYQSRIQELEDQNRSLTEQLKDIQENSLQSMPWIDFESDNKSVLESCELNKEKCFELPS